LGAVAEVDGDEAEGVVEGVFDVFDYVVVG
jgi:hypothetical protein